jgi:hypothetical protein
LPQRPFLNVEVTDGPVNKTVVNNRGTRFRPSKTRLILWYPVPACLTNGRMGLRPPFTL